MDSLKQFYTILVLFISTALFIIMAANNVYSSNTDQYIYIIVFVILFIAIIVGAVMFHKLYYSNRFFVYGSISMVVLLFIILISVNTYTEPFVGITLEPAKDGKTQVFSNDMDITFQDDISDNQEFGNGITIYEKKNMCVTPSIYFGTHNDKLECVSPFDEDERKEKEEIKRRDDAVFLAAKEAAKKAAATEKLKKYCDDNYISDKYPADEYCRDTHNNDNKYGVYKVEPSPPKCPGYQRVKCKRGYANGKKISDEMRTNGTSCYPTNSNFNDICQSVMTRKHGLLSTSKYGYKEVNDGDDGNCKKFESSAICSPNYYDGIKKTPYYTKCLSPTEINKDTNHNIKRHIINTDGCNPGYKRYCTNKQECLNQIAGHIIKPTNENT